MSTPEHTRVYAATNSNLNFQGRILSPSGSTVPDGNYHLQFKLYDGGTSGGPAGTGPPNNGALLWTETYTSGNLVRVVNGYFSVNLGSATAFPAINWDQELWLTMNVGGSGGSPAWDGEMLAPGSKRTKLTAVPFAFQSKQSEILKQAQGANIGTLEFLNLTASRNIALPDKNGTICIAGSPDCIDVITTASTAVTASNSGLEIGTDGLRLIGGCSDGQMLRWNNTAKQWECTSGSGASIGVRESDGSPLTTASTLEFGASLNSSDEFVVSNEGGGVTRIRLGSTVLTTGNYAASGLDTAYVNYAESPSVGDITGSFSSGLTIGVNSVALGNDTTGNYVSSIGTVTGLTLSGNTGEGSTPGLSINYGSTSTSSVRGDTQLTCASGSGDLSGGGTVITLGTGGTCAAITISESPVFDTSVTTPQLISAAGLTISTGTTVGADDIIFQTAGTEKLRLLENGNLSFEKGANDVIFSVASPGEPVTYTFSGASGTVLTTGNYAASGLDTAYVNYAESPSVGDITGSFSAGLTIGVNSVTLGTDTTGNFISSLGTLTGLSVTGNSGEGSTPALSVVYGSIANAAVQGNTQLTCASGSGNLFGGGTVITLGSGGSCGAIAISNAPTFTTSVTTPLLTNNGAMTISTTGGTNGLSISSGSGNISLGASTISTTNGLVYDLVSAASTSFTISNSGAGLSHLNLADGGLQVGGTEVLNNSRSLSNLTGISSSGAITLTTLTTGGIVKAAAGGGLSLATAGTDYENPLTFNNGLTRTGNTVTLGGSLTSNTTLALDSNSLTMTGTSVSNFIRANSNGALEIRSNQTSALAIRNQGGTVTYFDVNPSGNIVQVGSSTANASPILFVLNSFNGAADPTGVNGAMYYSTVLGTNRCFESGYWSDCASTRVQSDVTLGAAASSISLTLPGSTETSLQCRIQVAGRTASSTIYMRFNNVTTGNAYSFNVLQNLTGATNNTTTTSSGATNQIQLTGTAASTNPGSFVINVNNISSINKSADWTGVGSDATGVANNFKGAGTYFNTSTSISSVQFSPSSGNFAAGSRAWCDAR